METKAKTPKGWKVVRLGLRKDFQSATDWRSCRYFPGSWTHRPEGCGPLTCFRTRESARSFAKGLAHKGQFLVKPCIFKPSKDTDLWCPCAQKLGSFPLGTIFADRIKLTRIQKAN